MTRLLLAVVPAFILLFLGVAGWVVSIRALPAEALVRLLFVLQTLFTAGGIAALWLAAAVGLGRLARPLFRNVRVSLTELDRIQRSVSVSDPLVSVPVVEAFLVAYGRPVALKEGISGIYELRTEASAGGARRR